MAIVPSCPCACHSGPECACCAYTVPAGRVRVSAARSEPAAHVLSQLAVCVSQRPGVSPLRVYCPCCGCYHGVDIILTGRIKNGSKNSYQSGRCSCSNRGCGRITGKNGLAGSRHISCASGWSQVGQPPSKGRQFFSR